MALNIEKLLMREMSRNNTNDVVQLLIKNPDNIHSIVDLSMQHDNKLSMRASWALEILSVKLQNPLEKYIEYFILELPNIKIEGTLRTLTKVLMLHNIPEESEGLLFDFCMQKIESSKSSVAVKANCISLIFGILPKYPDLKNEVFVLIEKQIPYNSSAFKSRFYKLAQINPKD
jgi:hypothetical protein